ncbi:MAG: DUF4838 domain-containing protein, partial [Armatimonadetes bacterium]|nr:DUF4838 domain-containing protein [Armatimonadota bacterium]
MRGTAMLVSMGLCVLLTQASEAAGLTLAEDGKSDYAIVVADQATAPEATAATELQQYLTRATGVEFRIVKEGSYPENRPAILVGRTRRTERHLRGFDWEGLGTDGIVIRTAGQDLILAGGRPRGTLYAVVTFLEEQVGVRWWTATEEDVPSRRTLKIGALQTVFVPKLTMRHNFAMDLLGMQPYAGPRVSKEVSQRFCVHLRDTYNAGVPAEWGGSNTIYGCHTVPLQFLPKERYFDAHPEWYGLVGGERIPHQVCWTNKEMRQELTRNVLAFLREHPEVTAVSVSQNDGGNPCECAECRALVEREGTQMGPILDGVNEVADAVAREHPGVMVETLSYFYSRKCPKTMRARDNVLIRVCTYEQTINKPLTESDFNLDNRTNVLEWGDHTNNLFVWNYVTDFRHYMYPQPNLFHLAPNLRFFVEHNAKGVFMQGDAFCQTGDFQQLRAWVVSHLLWDPYQDDRKLIREFCDGYYGAAGRYVYAWIEAMCQAGYDFPGFIGIYNGNLSFLTLDVMNRGVRLWAEAERAVADDPVRLNRVRKARLSFDLAWIVRSEPLAAEAKAAGKTLLGPADTSQVVDQFFTALK